MSTPAGTSDPSTPTSPATAPGTAPGSSTSSPSRKPNRTLVYIAVAVAVALAVILVAVFLVLPASTSSSPGTTGGALTYKGARPIANATASGFSGGGWVPVASAGLVTPSTEVVPVNSISLDGLHCTFTAVSGNGNFTLPSYAGNRSGGASPVWEFVYRNASGVAAVVSVIDGKGTVLGTLSGSECKTVFDLLLPIPGNVIDSSVAAAAIEPNASAFLSTYPNASAEYGLSGGVSIGDLNLGPEWRIVYTSCAFNTSDTGSGEEFNATVNATSGRVLTVDTAHLITCGSSTSARPLTSAPVFGSVEVRTARPNASFANDLTAVIRGSPG